MSTDRLAQSLARLQAVIDERTGAPPESSYTAKLLSQGRERIAKKLGEEAVETVIAAVAGDAEGLAAESADLLYHWLVLLNACGVPVEAVAAKLDTRAGLSGLDEKASRPPE